MTDEQQQQRPAGEPGAGRPCACGHERDWHVDLVFGCKATVDTEEGWTIFCACRRFTPAALRAVARDAEG